jgi:predicted signal transduction protein with EAL and GGDEF domain
MSEPRKQLKKDPDERSLHSFRTLRRRRVLAVRRQTQLGRLRISFAGLLLVLVVMMAAWFRTTETMLQRQQTVIAACQTHTLFAYLDSALGSTRAAASNYVREGTPTQRSDYDSSFTDAVKVLDTIRKRRSPSKSSAGERYTDLLPRIRIYLQTLETSARLRHDKRRQEATVLLANSDAEYGKLLPLSRRLRSQEESRLAELTQGVEREAERLQTRMWIGASLLTVILGVTGLFFSRDLRARTHKEQELRSANRTLTRLAEQDSLTGLKNRRALEEELHTEWAHARRTGTPLSVLIVDVDNFKDYNDAFGHQAGDEALKQVAGLLRREETLSGSYVARYGGEEFAVILASKGLQRGRGCRRACTGIV